MKFRVRAQRSAEARKEKLSLSPGVGEIAPPVHHRLRQEGFAPVVGGAQVVALAAEGHAQHVRQLLAVHRAPDLLLKRDLFFFSPTFVSRFSARGK